MVGNSTGRCDLGTSKQPLTHCGQSPGSTGSPKTRMMAAKVQKAPLSPKCTPNLESCCKSSQERYLGVWIRVVGRAKVLGSLGRGAPVLLIQTLTMNTKSSGTEKENGAHNQMCPVTPCGGRLRRVRGRHAI